MFKFGEGLAAILHTPNAGSRLTEHEADLIFGWLEPFAQLQLESKNPVVFAPIFWERIPRYEKASIQN